MILKNTNMVCIEFGWWDTEGRSLWFQAKCRSTSDSAANWLFSAACMQNASNRMQVMLMVVNREEQQASFAPRSRHLFDKIIWGSLPGQESTIWEIYYRIGKMGLLNKAIPNSQYGWKTRYILMQVKAWHKTWGLNWQNFWHTHKGRASCERK